MSTTKTRRPKVPRADYAQVPALDPIVETAAQLTFSPPTSACSALDARLMAEVAFGDFDQMRADASRLPEVADELETKTDEYDAIDRQFDNYQEMLRDFMNDKHDKYPGAWEEWIAYRTEHRNQPDDICELGTDRARRSRRHA